MAKDTRNKLVDLIESTPDVSVEAGILIADHLIANGVTIQKDYHWATEQAYKNGYEDGKPKWIPVTERLPDAWVDVLSCDRNKNLTVDCVDEKGKWYSEYTDLEEVTHWMPLPSMPGDLK